MPHREWNRHSINMNGQMVQVHTIRCSNFPTCRTSCDIPDRRGKAQSPPEVIEKRFTHKGWFVGASEKHDLCPECAAQKALDRRLKRRPHATNIQLVVDNPEGNPMTSHHVEAPRQMSRDDKRIINAKLHEVYIGERDGYQTPWSDRKVAEFLGCPVAWISEVREELFGDVADNGEIRDFLDRAERAKAEAQRLLDVSEGICARMTVEVKSLTDLATTIKETRRLLETINITAQRIAKAVNA